MERFGTFKIDHRGMNVGIYLARIDDVGGTPVYTLDIRTCRPYEDDALDNVTIHSVEHILATALENSNLIQKIYFGPMGCGTGFYLVCALPDDKDLPKVIGKALIEACNEWNGEEVPFNSEIECGNCKTLATSGEDLALVALEIAQIKAMAQLIESSGEFGQYNYIDN